MRITCHYNMQTVSICNIWFEDAFGRRGAVKSIFGDVVFNEFSSVYGGVGPAGLVAGAFAPDVQGEGFTPDDAHLTMLTLERDYPEWFALHESSLDPMSSTRQEMLNALATAPCLFIGGFIYNALIMRAQIAQITGRKFD